MDSGDRQSPHHDTPARARHDDPRPAAGRLREHPVREHPVADVEEDDGADADPGTASSPLIGQAALPDTADEQAAFRAQFDEDLYNDREDRPAQGNTADVAMGDQRFGSEADAYSEYAWRRPGDHRSGDASAVGQARDPADIADEDERP